MAYVNIDKYLPFDCSIVDFADFDRFLKIAASFNRQPYCSLKIAQQVQRKLKTVCDIALDQENRKEYLSK